MKVRIRHLGSKAWRFTQRLFLIAGLLALGFTACSYVARFVYQAYENWEFDRALEAHNVAPSPPQATVEQHPSTASWRLLIGRLAIPRLEISAMVLLLEHLFYLLDPAVNLIRARTPVPCIPARAAQNPFC